MNPANKLRGPTALEPELGGVLDFMRGLWALSHALERRSRVMEQQLGVTGPQRLVIRIVGRFPQISAGQLSDIMHVHPSTLSGVLRRLEGRNLIKRRIDPLDGRRALFGLTDAGRQIDAGTAGTVEAAVRTALAKVNPTTRAAAAAVLQTLVQQLGAADHPERVRGPRPTSH